MNGNNGAFGNLEIGPVISVEMQPSLPASSEKSNENTEKQPHQEDDKKTESTSNSETSINDSESKQESTPKEPTEALSPQALESSALVEAAKSAANEEIDWSKFAYIQYVTNALYLCNSVMIFEQLHRFNVKADKVLLYPKAWDDHGFIGVAKAQLLKKNRKKQTGDFKTDHDLTSENKDQPQENVQESTNPENSKIQKRGRFEGSFKDIEIAGHVLEMLELLRSEYGVKTKPIDIIHVESEEETWAESFTKFLIFDQTEYDRVLFMDSDGVVLKSMDELFLTKSAKIAATRAYWLDPDSIPEDNKHGEQVDKSWMTINAQWELVEPSNDTFGAITSYLQEKHPDNGETVDNDSKSKEYDMDIFNKLFKDDTVILPHRNIMMLSGELRGKRDKHLKYLGPDENWDVDHVMSSIAYIHFSDWPFPKVSLKLSQLNLLLLLTCFFFFSLGSKLLTMKFWNPNQTVTQKQKVISLTNQMKIVQNVFIGTTCIKISKRVEKKYAKCQ